MLAVPDVPHDDDTDDVMRRRPLTPLLSPLLSPHLAAVLDQLRVALPALASALDMNSGNDQGGGSGAAGQGGRQDWGALPPTGAAAALLAGSGCPAHLHLGMALSCVLRPRLLLCGAPGSGERSCDSHGAVQFWWQVR